MRIDYEDLILSRQEAVEIAEDNYGYCDNGNVELVYNPVLMKMIAERYIGIAKGLAKDKAPDSAFNDLIETLADDETIDNQTYAVIYGEIMEIYKTY